MSTTQNDDDTTPRSDGKQTSNGKGSDGKERSDKKEGSDGKQDSDKKKGSKRKSPEERMSDLKQKRDQLNNKIDRLTATVRTRDRKRDTRRKIIAGAAVLTLADRSEKFREFLTREARRLRQVRPRSRAVLGLPVQEEVVEVAATPRRHRPYRHRRRAQTPDAAAQPAVAMNIATAGASSRPSARHNRAAPSPQWLPRGCGVTVCGPDRQVGEIQTRPGA